MSDVPDDVRQAALMVCNENDRLRADLAALTEKLARAEAENAELKKRYVEQVTLLADEANDELRRTVQVTTEKNRLAEQLAAAREEREEVVAAIEWVLSDAKYRSPELINDVAERWIARLKQAARS